MRIIKISDKVYLVRHWFVWYNVQRGMSDWKRLKVQPRVSPVKNYKQEYPNTPADVKAAIKDAVSLKETKNEHKKRAV